MAVCVHTLVVVLVVVVIVVVVAAANLCVDVEAVDSRVPLAQHVGTGREFGAPVLRVGFIASGRNTHRPGDINKHIHHRRGGQGQFRTTN